MPLCPYIVICTFRASGIAARSNASVPRSIGSTSTNFFSSKRRAGSNGPQREPIIEISSITIGANAISCPPWKVDFKTRAARARQFARQIKPIRITCAINDHVKLVADDRIHFGCRGNAACLRIASFSACRPISTRLHPVRFSTSAQSSPSLPSPMTQT